MGTNAIRWVLVPIDFSDASYAAAERAAWIADRLDASLHFVHATEPHDTPFVYGGAGLTRSGWRSQGLLEGRELAVKELAAMTAKFKFLGPKVTSEVVSGRPLWAVREAIHQGRGDLVVLGVHPHHSWWHRIVDSTSDRAIRVLPKPVIAVKGEKAHATGAIQSMLAMIDFSATSDSALDFAIDLARRFDARLDVLHALSLASPTFPPYDTPPPLEWIERIRSDASKRLATAIDRVHRSGVQGKSHLVDDGPVDAIGNKPASDADLVVMGTRGHTGLKHLVLGSVAERSLHQAQASVAVVH